MGKQIYFSTKEIESLCDFFNDLQNISPDEDTYAYWQKRTGSAQYKIFSAKQENKKVSKMTI